MDTQEIKGEDYIVKYDPTSETVTFIGELSLSGPSEYEPITNLLNEVAKNNPETMTINLKELSFLNSSGISMLSKFVMFLRKQKTTQLIVLGSKYQPWQGKSLQNLVRLLNTLKLEIS